MLERLAAAGLETVWNVLPIVVIIFAFQLFVIRRRMPNPARVVVGFLYVLIGLTLFLVGLEQALFPLGKAMAQQLTAPAFVFGPEGVPAQGAAWGDYLWVYVFAACLAFATAVAEPALMAVALKAEQVSGGAVGFWGLRLAVALGAALGTAFGTFRIVSGAGLAAMIVGAYGVVALQTMFAPRAIVPLAFDSGGVTTSTVTVPLVTALGLGLAGTIPGRSALVDGFGLIAFTCLVPVITVMGYAQITAWWVRRRKPSNLAQED
ncbi:MAG: DUF1538 domain-containing protein [Gammaproteobacteria bacterium]|nr:DUF1538 domain-containing protein [Gammaproteobacteria bacterium]